MKKLILAATIAIIGLPAIASAQTAPAMPAGIVTCRPAASGETSNAAMGSTQLVCHKVDVAKAMAAQKTLMSMMPKGMTAAQMKSVHAAAMTMHTEFLLPAFPGDSSLTNNY